MFEILDKYLHSLKEKSILVITSKIVSICEENIIKIGSINKKNLIIKEADYFLPWQESKYNMVLTIKNNLLIPTAGIDESNGAGYYILWPKDSQKIANLVVNYLKKRFSLKKVGAIITDSRTVPLRWGTIGAALAHSGFRALKNYINRSDLFGRKLKFTKANIADSLAAAAVIVMGEGNEQTPLAIIEDVLFVRFQSRHPTRSEIQGLKIAIKDDLYAPLLTKVGWQKGGR